MKNKSLYALLVVLVAFASPNLYNISVELPTADLGTYLSSATVSSVTTAYADFVISVTPTSQVISAGDSTTYTITIAPRRSYSGSVTLTISNLPHGVTAQFDSSVVYCAAGGVSTTLRINADRSTNPGTYTLIITSKAVQSHSTIVELIIRGPAAKWTVMVYMACDNDIEPLASLHGINRMEIAGSTAEVNIVVLFDRKSANEATLYYVTKESPPTNRIISPEIASWGPTNMGDPETLRRFISWTAANYKAYNYALVLQNHGGGFQGLCWDDHSVDHLAMEDLRKALSDAGIYFEVIVFYACLMQMVEVAYQIKEFAHYMVGSEEVIAEHVAWGEEINYNQLLAALVVNPYMTPRQLAMKAVEVWGGHPLDAGGLLCTISAVDLSQVDDLLSSLDSFAKPLIAALPTYRTRIEAIRGRTDRYYYPGSGWIYIDLYHFAMLISQDSILGGTALGSASRAVMSNIEKTVVSSRRGIAHPKSHGLSIYFPESGFNDYVYSQLRISKYQWDEFVRAYQRV